jgi:hypothetical protein
MGGSRHFSKEEFYAFKRGRRVRFLVFKRGGGFQYCSNGEYTFKVLLEYIKFDDVRGKMYTNRKWQIKWNPSTTIKWWVLLWEYCKGI